MCHVPGEATEEQSTLLSFSLRSDKIRNAGSLLGRISSTIYPNGSAPRDAKYTEGSLLARLSGNMASNEPVHAGSTKSDGHSAGDPHIQYINTVLHQVHDSHRDSNRVVAKLLAVSECTGESAKARAFVAIGVAGANAIVW